MNDSFLGRGWRFPPGFQRETNGAEMSAEEDDVRESLEILLSTRVGERLMHPDYGCNLDEMIFEYMDLSMQTYIRDMVETAIVMYEPRVVLENVELISGGEMEGKLLLSIDYRIAGTNSCFNYVYPFYKTEGTSR